MKRLRWNKGAMVAGYRMLDCRRAAGKEEFHMRAAKLRKNCDAHTYKRRPVNSMDPPPRRVRFQSVSSPPPPPSFVFRTKRYAEHARRRGHTYAYRSVLAPAQAQGRICAVANEYTRIETGIISVSWISCGVVGIREEASRRLSRLHSRV